MVKYGLVQLQTCIYGALSKRSGYYTSSLININIRVPEECIYSIRNNFIAGGDLCASISSIYAHLNFDLKWENA